MTLQPAAGGEPQGKDQATTPASEPFTARRHNLPTQLTSFVGRDAELLDIEQLVASRRLITLTGPGGCGKTRLALQLCTRIADRWPDGIWFMDLGSVTDPGLVPRLTGSTVGVLIEPTGDQVMALAAQLRPRRILLCLDTCEHLLESTASLVDALLRSCPGVSVLATSREPLGVEGETVWRVPSLRPEEARVLFIDRAGLVAPHFDGVQASADVATVCSRVDHIPLAIELAAAWVRAMSPARIAAGLEDSFRFLAGGPRRAVPRHQTLLASMGWSHALLAAEEKVLFRRLAVFSGTFTLDAVTRVCLDSPLDAAADEALHLMGRLLDKSLVTVREVGGDLRYRLLDTLRHYAREQLHAAGEIEMVRDRHVDYFLDVAEDAEPGLDTSQARWREVLDGHRDNIGAALDWGLAPPDTHAERGRRLAAAMARQWFLRGQSAEGLDFLHRAIDLRPDDRSALQGRLLAGTAMMGMISGRPDLATDATSRGLEISEAVGDDVSRARCLALAAYPVFFVDLANAQAILADARAAGEAADDPFSRDWATVIEGYSCQARSMHDEAVALARLAFDRSWPRGDRFCAAFARGVELFVVMVTGDVRGAAAIGHEMIDIVTPLGDYFAVGTNTANAALAIGMSGNVDEARTMMEPIVRSVETTVEADVVGFMVPYGLFHLWDGDLEGAVRWFRRGIQRITDDHPRDWTATRCMPGLASALRRLGRSEEAFEYAAKGVAFATQYDMLYERTDALDEFGLLFRGTDPGRARALHHEALALRVVHGLRTGYAVSLDALAGLEADAGNHQDAARLLATSDAARKDMGYPRPPVDVPGHESLVESVRAALGDEELSARWDEGAARSLDDTVAALSRGRGPRNRPDTGWASLTPTELDVIELVAEGLSNPAIADRLYMSRSTVKAHLSHIFAKLGVTSRTKLATLAKSRSNPE